MAEVKTTRKEYFERLRQVVELANVQDSSELFDFIDHQIEIISHKTSKSGDSQKQAANAVIKNQIVETLKSATDPMTIDQIKTASDELATYSNQKLSALLKQLVDAGTVKRGKDSKRLSVFSLA